MTINPNDPRITAFALGEMEEEERVKFEQEIASDPEILKSIDEINELAGFLSQEMSRESAPALTAQQKSHIHSQAGKPKPEKSSSWWGGIFTFPRFAGAMVLCALIIGVLILAQPNYMRVRQKSDLAQAPLKGVSLFDHDEKLPAYSEFRRNRETESLVQVPEKHEVPASTSPRVPASAPVPVIPPMLSVDSSGAVGYRLTNRAAPRYFDSAMENRAERFTPGESNREKARVDDPKQWSQEAKEQGSQETYAGVVDNPFRRAQEEPLSTFSIDVDTASYSNVRRLLNQGVKPPPEAVRIEELLNYFPYDYSPPSGTEPFAAHIEWSDCPWAKEHRLARIALKGRELLEEQRPQANLVFLIDVSGSMEPENRLPLLKRGLLLLLGKLKESDRVAIVTYAGTSGLALPSTSCSDKTTIRTAIENLEAGGSTNGEAGIQLAYKTVQDNFLKDGINRVILMTDGDFNVGVTSQEELTGLITEKAKSGVFLSVLGFGMGNLKDDTLENLADKGNGNYGYIDNLQEARKLLVEQIAGTLVTIAKDVKIQIEFNPGMVNAYRLIGYENRILAAQDFNDDRKDAGEIGAGHTLTVLYEIVPVGVAVNVAGTDPLKYQIETTPRPPEVVSSPESFNLKLRYKQPNEDHSHLIEIPAIDSKNKWENTSVDFRFASAVATFGMVLRQSPYRGGSTLDLAMSLAQQGKGEDREGYRAEFIQLVGLTKALSPDR